jgi:plastocyanin
MPDRGPGRKWLLIVGFVLLACGVLVGCSPGAASTATPVRTGQVDLPPSYQFAPSAIEVGQGTTVTWTNHDNFTHSVQVQGQTEVHMLRPGETAQIRFDQPGTYPYVCTLHTQNMRGMVVVTGA